MKMRANAPVRALLFAALFAPCGNAAPQSTAQGAGLRQVAEDPRSPTLTL